jgi:hypothetical protein
MVKRTSPAFSFWPSATWMALTVPEICGVTSTFWAAT